MQLFDENSGFDYVREESHAQYGVGIAYVKDRVGEGSLYCNEVARAVLSETGGYYELVEMPEEFAGALGGGVAHRLAPASDVMAILETVHALTGSGAQHRPGLRALSLYALYEGGSLRACRELFVYDWTTGITPFCHGAYQPGVLPRFFKLRIEADPDAPGVEDLGISSGVIFTLTPTNTDDGRCLIGTFTRTPTVVDLGLNPMPATMN